eukprot:COSAG06_NODE_35928_length_453_cov_47.940678_1_plen_92_part_10
MHKKMAFFAPVDVVELCPCGDTRRALHKMHLFFRNFSHVCPEPVLVKRCVSTFISKCYCIAQQEMRFSHLLVLECAALPRGYLLRGIYIRNG